MIDTVPIESVGMRRRSLGDVLTHFRAHDTRSACHPAKRLSVRRSRSFDVVSFLDIVCYRIIY